MVLQTAAPGNCHPLILDLFVFNLTNLDLKKVNLKKFNPFKTAGVVEG